MINNQIDDNQSCELFGNSLLAAKAVSLSLTSYSDYDPPKLPTTLWQIPCSE